MSCSSSKNQVGCPGEVGHHAAVPDAGGRARGDVERAPWDPQQHVAPNITDLHLCNEQVAGPGATPGRAQPRGLAEAKRCRRSEAGHTVPGEAVTEALVASPANGQRPVLDAHDRAVHKGAPLSGVPPGQAHQCRVKRGRRPDHRRTGTQLSRSSVGCRAVRAARTDVQPRRRREGRRQAMPSRRWRVPRVVRVAACWCWR